MRNLKKFMAILLAVCLACALFAPALAAQTDEEAAEEAEAEEIYTAPVSNDVVASGTCGKSVTWVLEDDVLTISGTGAMSNYSFSSFASSDYRASVTSVVIESG